MKSLTAVSVLWFLLSPVVSAGAQRVSPPLFRIVQNGRYGYIDNTGKVIVQPQFVWASDFKGDFAKVYVCGRMVSMNEKGDLLPLVHKKLEARKIGDKFGFVDPSGQFKISAQYDDARWFSEGLAAVRVGNKWGYIDEAGEIALPFKYAEASAFEHGTADVIFGEIVSPNEIESMEANGDGFATIDRTGRVIVKSQELIGALSEDRMAVVKKGHWGYVDATGVPVIRFVYEDAHPFSEGLAAVQKKGKWGYIDKNGKVVIPFQYEEADYFSEGLAVVKKNCRSGYIEKNGRIVIPLEFDYADKFHTGLAAVIRGKESGFIDKSGNFAFHLVFAVAHTFRDLRDLSQFWTEDDHVGYVDHSGRVLWQSAAPENLAPFLFPQQLQEKREESCLGITDDVKKKVAQIPLEP